MAFKSMLPETIAEYVNKKMSPETPVQQKLRALTAAMPDGQMQISADQGRLLSLLVRMVAPAHALEIGTFTGYSALSIASALPAGGRLTCLDVSAEWTSVARRFWNEAGVAERITLRLGPARETLATMAGEQPRFGFAFIDADKVGYDAYYEALLPLMQAGGIMVFDNMLRHGEVVEPGPQEPGTEVIKALNIKLRDDPRVEAAFLTVGDGLHIVRKR